MRPSTPTFKTFGGEPSARAERYQVEILMKGADTLFRRVATLHDEFATVGVWACGGKLQR